MYFRGKIDWSILLRQHLWFTFFALVTPKSDLYLQLREGVLTGTLAGHKINYLDSGYSEEDADQQITSCLMKTSSGSIYIPPSKFLGTVGLIFIKWDLLR